MRTMITIHPYNTWPLYVKIFTSEAAKIWSDFGSAKYKLRLPPGFQYSIELEGVNGKSGRKGTGRVGEIDVKDGEYRDVCG